MVIWQVRGGSKIGFCNFAFHTHVWALANSFGVKEVSEQGIGKLGFDFVLFCMIEGVIESAQNGLIR